MLAEAAAQAGRGKEVVLEHIARSPFGEFDVAPLLLVFSWIEADEFVVHSAHNRSVGIGTLSDPNIGSRE